MNHHSSARPGLGRRATLLGISAALAAPVVGHAQSPIIVTDVLGRTVTLPKPAERISVSFYFEEFTAVAGVAGWDRVVGFDRTQWAVNRSASFVRYSAAIPRLRDLSDVGNIETGSFSLEKLLAVRPDLVMFPEVWFSVLKEPVAKLAQLGIPVIFVDYNAEIPKRHVASTIALGAATGNAARARELADLYMDRLGDIRRRVAGADRKPRVYIELGQGGANVVGNTYWQGMWGRLLDQIGAANIADGKIPSAWAPLNPEYILAANPEVIFIAGSSWANRPNAVLTGFDADIATTRARLAPYAQRPGWPGLAAIKAGELHAIEHGLCRALFDYTAMYYMAKQIYPAQFADIDPISELRRYHEKYLPVAFEGTWMARLT